MSINLKVEEYCHNCPDFEPEKKVEHLTEIDLTARIPTDIHKYETTISCKHCKRCAAQFKYLQKQHDAMMKKETCDGKDN